MKRWPIRDAEHAVATPVVSGVLAGIGTSHLAASYLAAMHRVLPVTFCTVFAVSATGRIETVSAASAYGNKMNEAKPHRRWAGRVVRRAAVYGVLAPEQSFVNLLDT